MDSTVLTGLILRGVGGLYWVDQPGLEPLVASARGLFRKMKAIPTAGDRVDCVPSGDTDRPWQIIRIHPRRNLLVRPSAANLDGLLITVSADDPPPDLLLVDKLLAVCHAYAIEPVLVLTKTDLVSSPCMLLNPYRTAGYQVLETALQDETGLVSLKAWLAGKTVCLAGQSGVGKSTLINRLWGSELMPVGSLSQRIGRGRHTTREVVFFPVSGGYLADTPGFSTLELSELGLDSQTLARAYPEIRQACGQCRFNDCHHLGEPGCAVPETGMDADRLDRYRRLRRDLDAQNAYA